MMRSGRGYRFYERFGDVLNNEFYLKKIKKHGKKHLIIGTPAGEKRTTGAGYEVIMKGDLL